MRTLRERCDQTGRYLCNLHITCFHVGLLSNYALFDVRFMYDRYESPKTQDCMT